MKFYCLCFGAGYNFNLYLSLYLRIFMLKNFKYWAKRKVEVEVSSQSGPSAPLPGDGWGRLLSRRVWDTWLPCRLWPAHKVSLVLMVLENILNQLPTYIDLSKKKKSSWFYYITVWLSVLLIFAFVFTNYLFHIL